MQARARYRVAKRSVLHAEAAKGVLLAQQLADQEEAAGASGYVCTCLLSKLMKSICNCQVYSSARMSSNTQGK